MRSLIGRFSDHQGHTPCKPRWDCSPTWKCKNEMAGISLLNCKHRLPCKLIDSVLDEHIFLSHLLLYKWFSLQTLHCSPSLSHIGDSFVDPYGGLGDKFSSRQGCAFDSSLPADNRCWIHNSWEPSNGASSRRAHALSSWRYSPRPSHRFFLLLYLCKLVSPHSSSDNPHLCRTRPIPLRPAQHMLAGKCQRKEVQHSACTAPLPCNPGWSCTYEEKHICAVSRTSPTGCTESGICRDGRRS